MDQSLFAAPHGLSQRITSFIACACQGIHQLPLLHLIILIANAHHYLDLANLSSSLALEGVPNLTIRTLPYPDRPKKNNYLLQLFLSHDAINVFDKVCFYMIWQTFLSRLRSKGCQIVGSTPVHSLQPYH